MIVVAINWTSSLRAQSDILATNKGLRTDAVQLDEVTAEHLVFSGGDGQEIVVPTEEFAWWNGPNHSPRHCLVTLANGCVLSGDVSFVADQKLRIAFELWQSIEIRLSSVQHVQFSIPANRERRSIQKTWLRNRTTQTRARLANGDSLIGELMPAQGGQLTQQKISLKSNGQEVSLYLDSLAAISFAARDSESSTSNDPAIPSTAVDYYLIDGCRITSAETTFGDDQIVATCRDMTLTLKRKPDRGRLGLSCAELVCGIRNQKHDLDYLSQLKPEVYKHEPLLGPLIQFKVDRRFDGSPFVVDGTHKEAHFSYECPFGISMPSRSSIVFAIEKPAQEMRFQFGLGLSDPLSDFAGVGCKVLTLDQKDRWQIAWEGPVSKGSSMKDTRALAVFHEIKIGPAKAIALTVDYGHESGDRKQGTDVRDEVNWLMPRIVR